MSHMEHNPYRKDSTQSARLIQPLVIQPIRLIRPLLLDALHQLHIESNPTKFYKKSSRIFGWAFKY